MTYEQSQQLYDADFFNWTQAMAERLRARDAGSLDWENIAEEIDSMGKRDYRALGSRMEVLLTHLLKWRYQIERRSRSWAGTIHTQRSTGQSELRGADCGGDAGHLPACPAAGID